MKRAPAGALFLVPGDDLGSPSLWKGSAPSSQAGFCCEMSLARESVIDINSHSDEPTGQRDAQNSHQTKTFSLSRSSDIPHRPHPLQMPQPPADEQFQRKQQPTSKPAESRSHSPQAGQRKQQSAQDSKREPPGKSGGSQRSAPQYARRLNLKALALTFPASP